LQSSSIHNVNQSDAQSFKPYEERLAAKKNQVKAGEPDFHEGEVVVIEHEQTALDIDNQSLNVSNKTNTL
jgi:stress response protein YsnF